MIIGIKDDLYETEVKIRNGWAIFRFNKPIKGGIHNGQKEVRKELLGRDPHDLAAEIVNDTVKENKQ